MKNDRHPTILLVEDSADEETLVMRAIRRATIPCQLVIAHTTEEALDYLFATGPYVGRDQRNPDVVITDLKVDSMGGDELISTMRSNPSTRLIPVVVLTGSASDAQIDDLYMRGANSFLEKPIDFEEFASLVIKTAQYWGALNTTTGVKANSPRALLYP